MLEKILMYKLKLFLVFIIFPLSYLVYHLIGFDNGINAYLEKRKLLFTKEKQKLALINKIQMYKGKIKLLKPETLDIDYLEEKTIYLLGKTKENTYSIIID